MIFVTVGSQKFQFDRLLVALDSLVEEGVISGPVFAQTGACTYEPKHMEHKAFLDRDEFARVMAGCDIVVTHGGTGAIVGALKQGKHVIAMPRLKRFGEHVDDHQEQLLLEFSRQGLVLVAHDKDELADACRHAAQGAARPYVSNNARFIGDLDAWLRGIEA